MKSTLSACLLLTLHAIAPASAAPKYEIVTLGLGGVEHTSSTGVHLDTTFVMNQAGQVIGRSRRFNGSNSILGQSAWLYDGTVTINIGLSGAEHTRNDGYKFSEVLRITDDGLVNGFSQRFGGSANLGQSAWLYNGTATIDIGLMGPEYARNDGYKFRAPRIMNGAGDVTGYSQRFNGFADLGQRAWRYDGAMTTDIGLTGVEHTRADGYKFSLPQFLNEAGQVIGSADRFNGGNADLGKSVWLDDGTTTTEIGLTGAEHTRNDGYQRVEVSTLNQSGFITGHSYRYNGGSDNLGASAWLYDGTTTIEIGPTWYTSPTGSKWNQAGNVNESGLVLGSSFLPNGGTATWLYDGVTTFDIGLFDPEHTGNDGYRSNYGDYYMTQSGKVMGNALRFDSAGEVLGESAWIYDGTTTIRIGLTDAEHTSEEGYRFSRGRELNEAGLVIGYANGYGVASGDYAWLYNGVTTIELGFDDVEHTRLDGYRVSTVDQLNEAGQTMGFSRRYNGGNTELGQDAWLYDSTLDQTFLLQLSIRSDGYAYSRVNYLGEDGLALGTYKLYDALDNFVGDRAFYFTLADGLHDLGALVDGGLAANGWQFLADAFRANGQVQILGVGRFNSDSGGQRAYLLTPMVPEPSTLWAATLAACGLSFCRRRFRRGVPIVAMSARKG